MDRKRRWWACVATVLGATLAGATARADDGDVSFELTAGLGVSDRSTTGTGGALAGYGYDASTSAMAALDARVLLPINRYFRHGLLVQGGATGGTAFGLGADYAFRLGVVDVAYYFRTNCPCISSGPRQVYVGAFLGATVLVADAGTGSAPGDDRALWNERTAASSALDHVAVGWVLGVTGDLHVGPAVVGVTLAVRQAWGVGDAPVAREWLPSALARVGFALEPAARQRY